MKQKTTSKPTTSTATKPKPRTKAGKIAALKRSAASKSRWHRLRLRKQAHHHLSVFGLALAGVLCTGSVVVAMAGNLVAPPGVPIDLDAYLRAAQANRPPGVKPPDQAGRASWYALGLRSPDAQTCASRQFPRGTYLEVTDLRNGNKVVCLVNDYGPEAGTNRVIDLSRGSYSALEGLGSGTMPVEIRVTDKP